MGLPSTFHEVADTMPIRVVIAYSHQLLAEALAAGLREAGMDVVDMVPSRAEAIPVSDVPDVDVIIVDVDVPGRSTLPSWDDVRERWPDVKVLLMSSFPGERDVEVALQMGFHGYFTKSTSIEQATRGIEAAHRGEDQPFDERSDRRGATGPLFPGPNTKLTDIEEEVLGLLADGAGGRRIGDHLGLEKADVRSHVESIFTKLSVHSRLEAATWRVQNEPSLAHPHLDPMDEEQLLTHLLSMHPRGIAPYYPIDFESLDGLHRLLHRWVPPGPA